MNRNTISNESPLKTNFAVNMKRKQWFLAGLILLGAMIAIALSKLPPNWFGPDDLVNLSSVLTLISFTVQSILALRFLAISAQLMFIPYCLLQSPPLWTPAIWNVLFLAVNVVNVILLLLARRPVALNPDEEKLYNLAFKSLNPREFLKLLSLGEWREGEAGETLIFSGQYNSSVSILCRGEAISFADGTEQIKIPEGKLIGIASVLMGDPIPVDIKLKTPSRYICWHIEPLRKFLDQQPEIRAKLQLIVSHDLAQSVRILHDKQLEDWRKIRGNEQFKA
jgi:CRP-like cAMP-binding protein